MTSSADLPALLGGVPVRPQGPPDWPLPDDEVLRALQGAYQDGSWGKYHGGRVELLEQRLAEYHGLPFALACGSGTFAAETALRALKVGPDDEVLMAAYDYPGNFLSIHAVGATPVLVDVDALNWTLSPELLDAAVSPNTRAVIASHLHGGVVPMREVCAFAEAHKLRVIEDAAQAPGATVQGRKAGTWGDVGILSFGGSKLLTAGRGGALLTPHADVHQRARVWLHRGNHICPLSELQAATLLPQLDRLAQRNAHRAKNVRHLVTALKGQAGLRSFLNRCGECEPGYYKLGFQFDAAAFGLSRDVFLAAMRAEGMAMDEGFRALHVGRSPTRLRCAGPLLEAERAHANAIVLHHPVLSGSREDVEAIAMAVRKVYANGERISIALPTRRVAD
jgi:dTDP-4-amino-4,6-dideoxygalactose transaminase